MLLRETLAFLTWLLTAPFVLLYTLGRAVRSGQRINVRLPRFRRKRRPKVGRVRYYDEHGNRVR